MHCDLCAIDIATHVLLIQAISSYSGVHCYLTGRIHGDETHRVNPIRIIIMKLSERKKKEDKDKTPANRGLTLLI